MPLVLCLALVTSTPASASSTPAADAAGESAPDDTFQYDVFDILAEERQVVTTGTRIATKANESPSSLWIIDRQQIERMAAFSLSDLLRLVPGFEFVEVGPNRTEPMLLIPIRPNNQILYLIDGRSIIFDSLGVTDLQGLPIDLQDIERIEVVQGPSSTLYGASAFTGVINIVTRAPLQEGERLRGYARNGVAFGSEGGSGNPRLRDAPLGSFYAEYTRGFGKGGVKLSVSGEDYPSFAIGLTKQPQNRLGAALDATLEVDKWQLRAQLMAAKHAFQLQYFDATLVDTQESALNLQAKRPDIFAAGDQLSLGAWLRNFDARGQFIMNGAVIGREALPQYSGEVFAQYAAPLLAKNQLIAGLQLRLYDVHTPDMAPNAQLQGFAGLFVEDTFRPIEQLLFTGGVRLETRESAVYRALSHLTVSPRLAAVWLPAPGHSLRLEFGSAYRNPTPIENFLSLRATNGDPLLVSATQITAEQLLALSLGYQGRFGIARARVEASVSRYSNSIGASFVDDASDQTTLNGVTLRPGSVWVGKLPVFFENQAQVYWIPQASARLDLTPTQYYRFAAWYRFNPVMVQFGGVSNDVTWDRFTLSSQIYFRGPHTTDLGVYAARIMLNVALAVALDQKRQWELTIAGTDLAAIEIQFPTTVTSPHTTAETLQGERIGPRFWLGMRATFGKRD